MYKIFTILLTTIALMATLNATDIISDKTKLQTLKTKNKVLQDPSLEITAAIEKPDSYLLKVVATSPGGAQLLNIVLDKKSADIYIGTAYDKEGNMISFPKDGQVIKEGVAFSYGKGSKEIYLVTDPECPYCTRFEKAAKGKLDEYTVHVILMPLSFHKKAPVMIEWIMQGKDDVAKKKRFEALMLKGSTEYQALHKDTTKPFVPSSTGTEVRKKMDKAILELNVRGTPALFDANFEPLAQGQVLNTVAK